MKNGKPFIGAIGLGGKSVFLSVEHFHTPGETLKAEGIYIEAGGKAYNQAIAAARLGAEVFFMGAVGADASGELCKNTLLEEGITPVLETIKNQNTAYACILTDTFGENRTTVYRGASECLSAAFIESQENVIAQCSHLLLGLECPLEATLAALKIAKKHQVFTVLNPAPAIALAPEILQSFDLITPNLQEATVLLGLDDQPDLETLASCLQEAKLTHCVVTLGSEGALMVNEQNCLLFPAIATQAVDTTGAGDSFNAALAVRLSSGDTLEAATIYAINVSSLSVKKTHVLASLPHKEEVEKQFQVIQAMNMN